VVLSGCAEEACYNRMGIAWMEARIAGKRDPYLRRRVPRERILHCWAGPAGGRTLDEALAAFRSALPAQPTIAAGDNRPEAVPLPAAPVSAAGAGDD
jgi:hypothetical protein